MGTVHALSIPPPPPPTPALSPVLECEDLETSILLAKAQHPQGNLYWLDPRPPTHTPGMTPCSKAHQNAYAQSTNFILKANWLKPIKGKITYKLGRQNPATILYHRLSKLNVSEK